MNQQFVVSIAMALLTVGAATATQAQSMEEDAIKQVLRAEAMAFYNRNADAWQAEWVHDAKATRTTIASWSYRSRKGWDEIGPRMIKALEEDPRPLPVKPQWDNYIIHTDGNLAWVEYDQRIMMPGDSVPSLSREHRALVKRDGRWKILSQITEDVSSYATGPQAAEAKLNMAGYDFLAAKQVSDAIEVFKLNVKLFPDSWNVYDSLGEAYAAAGDTKLAIENYEKSLALNPASQTGKDALSKLRATKTP